MIQYIIQGFMTAALPGNLLVAFIGTVLGIVFGALPGLSGTMGIAVLLPITYSMQPIAALLFMISIFCCIHRELRLLLQRFLMDIR